MILSKDVHGVPLWLMREYLVELGAVLEDEQYARAPDWTAHFFRIEDFKLGSIVIGRVHLEIEAEEAVLAALEPRLDLKLTRGGG